MDRLYRFIVPAEGAGQRLDRHLSGAITGLSREKIKRAILEGRCQVHGLTNAEPGFRLSAGQEVELLLPEPAPDIVPEEGDIALLWHDEHMLVLNKPAGLTVHPCPSCPNGTLAQRLAAHFPQLARLQGPRPGIVHRLDKDTSGLLAAALTEEARLTLSASFAARSVRKEYLALVRGVPPEEGDVREPLGRHPHVRVKMAVVPENRGGKPAHTQWRTLWTAPGGKAALLRVRIHTGRTHQIRVHLAQAGFPLWGDAVYGGPAPPGAPPIARQMLHAWKLTLPHPVTGEELSFTCPPPQDMLEAVLALAAKMRRVILTGLPGCGKSSLLACLETRGLPVWSADADVKRLYAAGGDGRRFLAGRFGRRFVPDDAAPVNRAALGQAMREDPALRREVEAAIHDMVRHSLREFWRRSEARGNLITAAEIPLYLENGWRDEDALTAGVSCPHALRHQRLMERRGWTSEQCAAMDAWQWPEERKLAACQYIVDNGGPREALETQAEALLDFLESRRRQERENLTRHLEELWTDGAALTRPQETP